jgi:hypothetical protein
VRSSSVAGFLSRSADPVLSTRSTSHEFARKSDAKDADRRAVDTSEHRPEVLDDEDSGGAARAPG